MAPCVRRRASPPCSLRLTVFLAGVVALLGPVQAAKRSSRPASPLSSSGRHTATLEADTEEFDLEESRIRAVGNVHMTYDRLDLHAQEVLLDYKAKNVMATGTVRVEGMGNTLTGHSFQYDFGKQTGRLDEATVVVEGVTFHGESLRMLAGNIEIVNACLTTCSRSSPHYRLTTHEILIYPNSRAIAGHTSFWLGQRKLFTVPKYTLSLSKEETKRSRLFPATYVSGADLLYSQSSLSYPLSQGSNPPSVDATVGLSVRRGFRASLGLGKETDEEKYGLRVLQRCRSEDELSSKVLVSAWPEVYIGLMDYPLGPAHADVNLSIGRFQDSSTDATSFRAGVRSDIALPSWKLTNTETLKPHLLLGTDYYDEDQYSYAGLRLNLTTRLSRRLIGKLQYSRYALEGSTPFEFDDIDVPHELRASAEYKVNSAWTALFDVRYDFERQVLRDNAVGLLRTFDCVGLGITFDKARSELEVQVRVLGE